MNTPGTLYVVATPIGHLDDFSPRALHTLQSVALIAVEDKRQTAKLLQRFGITTKMFALHEHNERASAEKLFARLHHGEDIALVSDAGTPLISDPGYHLVALARAHQIQVLAIPGPCAAIAALSIAGFPTDRFVFEGFLPAKSGAKATRLNELTKEQRTLIFYEAPHRIVSTISAMQEIFGAEREVFVARELTKLYESHYCLTLAALAQQLTWDKSLVRGELVLIVRGAEAEEVNVKAYDTTDILHTLLSELTPKIAAKLTSRITGESKNTLYQQALAWQKSCVDPME